MSSFPALANSLKSHRTELVSWETLSRNSSSQSPNGFMRFLSALGDIGEKIGVGTNSRDVCFFCCVSGKGGSGSICDNSWPLQNQQNSWLPAQSCGTNAVDWIITFYSPSN